MKYKWKEATLAETHRLFQYMNEGVYGAEFTLKGFAYPWILESVTWRPGLRVLDVGAAYSPLPLHIASEYGAEVWVVDDFGTTVGEIFWERGEDINEFIRSNPSVKYVLERLGDPNHSTLPQDYFDVVYSASALEHVPDSLMRPVWQHMDLLVKPGGMLLHAIDIKLQADRGLRYLTGALIFDQLYGLLTQSLRDRYVRATPAAYRRQVQDILEVREKPPDPLPNSLGMLLDPEILLDPPQHTYNRIVKDRIQGIRHLRKCTLLLSLIKGEGIPSGAAR